MTTFGMTPPSTTTPTTTHTDTTTRAAGMRTIGVACEGEEGIDEALEAAADVVFEWDEVCACVRARGCVGGVSDRG